MIFVNDNSLWFIFHPTVVIIGVLGSSFFRAVFLVQSVLSSTKIGKLSFPAFELDYLQSYFPSLLSWAREKKSAIRNQLISFLVAQWKLGER